MMTHSSWPELTLVEAAEKSVVHPSNDLKAITNSLFRAGVTLSTLPSRPPHTVDGRSERFKGLQLKLNATAR